MDSGIGDSLITTRVLVKSSADNLLFSHDISVWLMLRMFDLHIVTTAYCWYVFFSSFPNHKTISVMLPTVMYITTVGWNRGVKSYVKYYWDVLSHLAIPTTYFSMVSCLHFGKTAPRTKEKRKPDTVWQLQSIIFVGFFLHLTIKKWKQNIIFIDDIMKYLL